MNGIAKIQTKVLKAPTFWVLLSSALQFLAFIFLARKIGVYEYGYIVAVSAISAVAVEFVGLGCGDQTVKGAATGRNIGYLVGASMVAIIVTLPFVALFSIAVGFLFFKIEVINLYFLLLTEIISLRLMTYYEHVSIATNQYLYSTVVKTFIFLLRLLLVLLFYFCTSTGTASSWALFQGAFNILIPSLVIMFWIRSNAQRPSFNLSMMNIEGLHFMSAQIMRAVSSVSDRYVAGTFLDRSDLGLYGTSNRFTLMAYMPLGVTLRRRYKNLFSVAADKHELLKYVKATLKELCIYGFLVCFLVLSCALFLPHILGEDYSQITYLLPILALQPLMLALNNAVLDVLTASGMQRNRSYLQAAGLIVTVCSSVIGVKLYGVYGLATGLMISSFICLFMNVIYAKRFV